MTLINVRQEIEEERARIMGLDSKLDVTRTPFAKAQLRVALSFLDDANTALQRNFSGDSDSPIWIQFATDCLRRAEEKRLDEVEERASDTLDVLRCKFAVLLSEVLA